MAWQCERCMHYIANGSEHECVYEELNNAYDKIQSLEYKLTMAISALNYYANDPAFDEKFYKAISSNFRSGNHAKETIDKIRSDDVAEDNK